MKRAIKLIAVAIIVILVLLVTASCVQPEYKVTFVLGDGRADVVATVQSGRELFTPEAPDEGKIFAGWYLDAEFNRPFMTTRLSADITLYARFIERGERTVTFVYNDGVTPDTTYLLSGPIPEPKEPNREGYVFQGWRDSLTGEYYDFGVETNAVHTTLTADWRATALNYVFTIDRNDGSEPFSYTYKYGTRVEPEAPSRNGYIFYGWFTNPECTKLYDSSAPLTKDVTVYAGWVEDMSGVANKIADEVLLSTVEVNVKHSRSNGYFNTVTATAIGSGVIYRATTNRYYVLTNHHVVEDQGYDSRTYTVCDAYGNEYSANLHYSSAAYDLAILSFAKGEKKLSVATLAAANPYIGEMLVAIGSPGSLNNVVTYGEMLKYQTASVEGGVVSFEVGWHNCPIARGSSGGAVFNSDLQLVGINFAASVDDKGDFLYGAFIQIERVIEFIIDAESKILVI